MLTSWIKQDLFELALHTPIPTQAIQKKKRKVKDRNTRTANPRSIRDLFLVWKVQKICLGSTSRKFTLMDPPKKGQQKNNIEGRVWRSKALVFAYRINHVPILKHTLLSVV